MSEAACEVWFYHLERIGPDEALPDLLEKTLQRGWRAVVQTPDAARLDYLDSLLWTYRDDSFLAHGRADEPGAARQPILLTTTGQNANGAQALFLIDGAEAEGLAGYARCVVLFDGADQSQLIKARGQWKAAKASGFAVTYWKQEARGWKKQGHDA